MRVTRLSYRLPILLLFSFPVKRRSKTWNELATYNTFSQYLYFTVNILLMISNLFVFFLHKNRLKPKYHTWLTVNWSVNNSIGWLAWFWVSSFIGKRVGLASKYGFSTFLEATALSNSALGLRNATGKSLMDALCNLTRFHFLSLYV